MSDIFDDDTAEPDPQAARRAAFESAIQPLARYWNRPDVEETVVNRWHEVGQRLVDGSWIWHQDHDITPDSIHHMLRILANRAGERFHERDHPMLYTDVGNKRLSAICGTAAAYILPDHHGTDTEPGIAIAVRNIAGNKRDLAAWGADHYAAIKEIVAGTRRLNDKFYADNIREDLIETMKHGGAILLVGGMGTGKTGFLNALVPYIPQQNRIIIIEDTPEIRINHHNRVHLRASRSGNALAGLSWLQLLEFVKRATPDVTICGEVSASNAVILWNLMNIGLSNFLTTVHGNSAADGVKAIYQQIANVRPELDYRMVTELIENAFSRIVYIERDHESHARTIKEYQLPHAITRSGQHGLDPAAYDKLRAETAKDSSHAE